MFPSEKVDEWIKEVEERPTSAANIIRYLGNRLNDLSRRNEDLRNENSDLRLEKKVDEFEKRIASLEYQLEVLKRQVGGELPQPAAETAPAKIEQLNLLAFTTRGLALRVELTPAVLQAGGPAAGFVTGSALSPDFLVINSQEELLFVFDSGRAVSLPASAIPASDSEGLDWEKAYRQPPQPGEELATILPIGRMSLYDYVVQSSRRGCAKQIRRGLLETYIANSYLGKGIKAVPDKMCGLTFAGKSDQFLLLSREGFLFSMGVESLPVSAEEVMLLNPGDHIVSSLVTGQKPSLLMVTQNGKAILRETAWIEQNTNYKSRGQPVFSKQRREAGTRLVGAAAVDEKDWAMVLYSDGRYIALPMTEIFDRGAVLEKESTLETLAVAVFRLPGA